MRKEKLLEKLGMVLCVGIAIIELLKIRHTIWLENKLKVLKFERAMGTAKVPTREEVFSEGISILQKALMYSRISRILIFLLIVLVIVMYFKSRKTNTFLKENKINYFLLSLTGIIGVISNYFVNTSFMGYTLLISALLTLGGYVWINFQNSNKENFNPVEENKTTDEKSESENKDFFLNSLPIIFCVIIFFINLIKIFDIFISFNKYKKLELQMLLGEQNKEIIKAHMYSSAERMSWYSDGLKISIFLLLGTLIFIILKTKNKNKVLEELRKNFFSILVVMTGLFEFFIMKKSTNKGMTTSYLLATLSLLAIINYFMKKILNKFFRKEKAKNITNKTIIFTVFLVMFFLLNIGGWIFFMNKIRESVNNKHNNNTTENDIEYEVKSGYKYKKSNGESPTFTPRNLGYAENLINNLVSYEDLRKEYCETVNEIVKVDNGIMPGTTKPFEEVTYTQVDDAYREHLQKIAQIRQVFDTIYGNDNDLENGAGCHYTGTHWNNANSQYKAKQFYDSSIIKYLNNHGYGVKNSVNSYSKKENKENENNDIENIIDNTINQINQTQNNSSSNSDESDIEYLE